MKFKKGAIALALTLLTTSAFADVGMYILENEYIKAGVNGQTGTLGSGGNTNPGLQYDNTGTRTFNPSYDYLTPGSPYEGWAVRIDDASGNRLKLYGNNNAGFQMDGNTTVSGAWVGTPTASSAVWAGSTTEFDIKHTYSLPSLQKYLDITTRLDAKSAMSNLYFGRYIDPDAVAAPGDSSATDNVRGYGIIPKTNVVFSEATVSRYALGLYSAQVGGVNTSIQGWTSDPKNYYLNTNGNYDVGTGDDTIGIGFYANNVAVGDILTWKYAYIFGPSAFGAADSAISGGAGGGTAGTSSFGTLTNVGSATDAASNPTPAPTTPTVVSTSTSTITISDTTVVNTSLPVIVASLAHHEASEGNGKQTIARETTTNTTTPYTRSVVTLDRTVTTYSDSTTTTTDSATTTTNTLVNQVDTTVANDSFSGRIDQMNYLSTLNKQLDRSLNMDAFRADGVSRDDVTMYINASGSKSSMGDGYSGKSNIYGLGIEKAIDSNWRLGVQYNRVTTTMNGEDSTTGQDKNHFGLFNIIDVDGFKVVNNLGYSDNTIKSNRTIRGIDFNNSHNTTGNDVWLNNRVYTPELEGFRPFVGVTVGRSTVNGYTEGGSIQSARTVGKQVDNYTYGEGGVRYEKAINDFRLMGEVSQSTDNFTTGSLTVGYKPTANGMIALTGTTQSGNNVTTNTVTLRGIIRF